MNSHELDSARTIARKFINLNRAASRRFDGWLSPEYRIDGNRYFFTEIVPPHLRRGLHVYDVGGGSRPLISALEKEKLNIVVTGLDIAADELMKAPPGSYDAIIVADLTTFRGGGDGDLAICQAVLEHVDNVEKAMEGMASLLKPGGVALVFVPCRNAVFARINLLLPEALKRRILFRLLPETDDGHNGFKAHYDNGTPRDLSRIARASGFDVIQSQVFWKSAYFQPVLPVHLLWRLWQMVARRIWGEQMAESFVMVLKRVASRAEA